jgi:hypothetical protein
MSDAPDGYASMNVDTLDRRVTVTESDAWKTVDPIVPFTLTVIEEHAAPAVIATVSAASLATVAHDVSSV